MKRCLDPRIWLCLTLPFLLAFAPHDGADSGKSINNSAPPGIGGDGPWESRNMILLGRLTLGDIGAVGANVLGNDCWGWTDALENREYAICGLTNATSFVDITDPEDPKYLGKLPTQTGNAAWRDVKVYNNHAYIVSDANGDHGVQIFDLTQLRDADPTNPSTFANSAWYDGGTGSAHNIAINESSGYAYLNGSEQASGGLQVIDIRNPLLPVSAGDFSADGYTHDCQVVNYNGPDSDYDGAEIAFCCNEDTVTIVDVSDKTNMVQISRNAYAQDGYTHQGWLSEDHRYFYMGDELDERDQGGPTRTHVFDCLDLDNPVYRGYYSGVTNSIDHNLYTKGDMIFCGNYSSGLRVLEIDVADPTDLTEVAYFDTYNTNTGVNFDGVWSIFPYYDSGTILVHDRQNGMFLVKLSPISIEFPNGRPELIDPAGVVEFTVQVSNFAGTAAPGTGTLHVDSGSGFQAYPMNEISPGLYEAEFPATDCATQVRYFVSAKGTDGCELCVPSTAPSLPFTAWSARSIQTIFYEDFEASSGWTVTGDATDGQWESGVPAGGGDRGDPPADGDGSGTCFLTDNEDGNSDIDGGSTILTSPVLDASVWSDQQVLISYDRWYSNDVGGSPATDIFEVDISSDGGSTWVDLETVGPAGSEISGGWFRKTFRVSDFVPPTDQMRLRFTASDLGNGSVVEAGVDGIEIRVVDCATPLTAFGSKLLDGEVAGGDFSNLHLSDDLVYQLDPSPTLNPYKQKIRILLQSETDVDNPRSLTFRTEARMSGGPPGDVFQRIALWNYVDRRYDLLDSRPLSDSDHVIQAAASGDLTRYIHPINGEVTASITWVTDDFSGSTYFWDVDVDQLIWRIGK